MSLQELEQERKNLIQLHSNKTNKGCPAGTAGKFPINP